MVPAAGWYLGAIESVDLSAGIDVYVRSSGAIAGSRVAFLNETLVVYPRAMTGSVPDVVQLGVDKKQQAMRIEKLFFVGQSTEG